MEEKNTIVAGKATGETTKSGNNIHGPDGRFTSKDGTADTVVSAENKDLLSNDNNDDMTFDENEFDNIKDLDIDSLLFDNDEFDKIKDTNIDELLGVTEQLKDVNQMSTQELIKEINDCKKFFDEQGIVFKNYKGMFGGDLKLRCISFRQMKKLLTDYKIDMNDCIVRMSKAKNYAGAVASHYPFDEKSLLVTIKHNAELEFASEYLSTYEGAKAQSAKEIKSGFSNDVNEELIPCYTMLHELGHILHNTMFKDYLEENGMTSFKMKEFTQSAYNATHLEIMTIKNEFIAKLKKDVYDQYIQDNDYIEFNEFKKKNSKYGTGYGNYEWFAEVFASANGGKPTDVAKAFIKVLKNKGYYKGGM